MKLGCLLSLLLLPITLIIWVEKERRRRTAMSPEELKALEDEEKYGTIDPDIECIYCHKKNCVRTSLSMKDAAYLDMVRSHQLYLYGSLSLFSAHPDNRGDIYHARCMKCESYWDLFDPHEDSHR